MTGIYIFTNKINNKQYVGRSINIENRIYRHKILNDSNGSIFKRAIKKYGSNSFNVIKIQYPTEELNTWEQYYIEEFNTKIPFGYNLTDGGEGKQGYKLSQEQKDKISNSLIGKYVGENAGFYGYKHTEETKKTSGKKISDKLKGKPKTKTHKNNLSLANMGKHNYLRELHNEDWRKNQSEKMTGNKNPNAKKYTFISPKNKEFMVIGEFKNFCMINKLGVDSMRKVLNGTQKRGNHKGWTVIRNQEE